jgi:chemotaxis protein methyltransferase CheR
MRGEWLKRMNSSASGSTNWRGAKIVGLAETSAVRMGAEEFRLIQDLLRRHCGLHFDEHNRYLLESRLAPRLQQLGLRTFRDYYLYLRFHNGREAELEHSLNVLTTNETYFFRESQQLAAFSKEILPALREEKIGRGERTLRIWSAGCSSGEEPYTLAMLILESGLFASWRVEVVGTDISQRVLQLARQGLYGPSSFRMTDQHYIDRYFEAMSGKWRIGEDVRRMVSFGHLNLLDSQRVGLLQPMDIIFCRNVIIYFDAASKRRVIDIFHERLVPGGYLLLGHAESLINLTTSFALAHLRNDMVYRKPA